MELLNKEQAKAIIDYNKACVHSSTPRVIRFSKDDTDYINEITFTLLPPRRLDFYYNGRQITPVVLYINEYRITESTAVEFLTGSIIIDV